MNISAKIMSVLIVSTLLVGVALTLATINKINEMSGNDFSKIITNLVSQQAVAIAHTFDASINETNLNAVEMQAMVDRNIKYHGEDFMREIRIHAPSTESANGYKAIAGTAEVGEDSDPEDIEAIKNDKIVVVPLKEGGENLLDVTVPLHVNGKSVATAGIQLATTKIEAEQAQILENNKKAIFAQFILITIAVVLTTVLIGLFISAKITGPIRQLTSVAKKISNGEVNVQLPEIKSRDEVYDLNEGLKGVLAAVRFLTESVEELTKKSK